MLSDPIEYFFGITHIHANQNFISRDQSVTRGSETERYDTMLAFPYRKLIPCVG